MKEISLKHVTLVVVSFIIITYNVVSYLHATNGLLLAKNLVTDEGEITYNYVLLLEQLLYLIVSLSIAFIFILLIPLVIRRSKNIFQRITLINNSFSKSLVKTCKHILLSITIVIIIYMAIFIFGYNYFFYLKDFNINIVLEPIRIITISIFLMIPLFMAVFVSYLTLYSDARRALKYIVTILLYLLIGLIIPLILVSAGLILYEKDKEAGFIILFGTYLSIPTAILALINYFFMYYRNRNLWIGKRK